MRSTVLRAWLVAGVAAIAGCGGGGNEAVYCPFSCSGNPPPGPDVTMTPSFSIAQVGSPASFTVSTVNTTGALTYQWHRSSDNGASYMAIPGATSATYSIASIDLADDQALFRVDVSASGVATALSGFARLAVTAQPVVDFQDDQLQAASWQVSPLAGAIGAMPVHTEESLVSGGNPGAYRKMTLRVPAGSGGARVAYTSPASTYDPATQGAIYVIEYSEDCIDLSGFPGATLSGLLVEQGGRRFVSAWSDGCYSTNWTARMNRQVHDQAAFRLLDGPACPSDDSCLDFSATAAPMRFGYWRFVPGESTQVFAHGIDNWKVTVWPR